MTEWAEGMFLPVIGCIARGVGAWYGAEEETIVSEHSTANHIRARISVPSTFPLHKQANHQQVQRSWASKFGPCMHQRQSGLEVLAELS